MTFLLYKKDVKKFLKINKSSLKEGDYIDFKL